MTSRRRHANTVAPVDAKVGRRHRADNRLMLFMGLLVLVGLVVLFAISPYQIHRINSEGGSLDQSHYMLKQLTYLGIGLGAFIGAMMIPLAWWKRFAGPLVIVALALSALLAVLGAFSASPAMCFNGACRWFDLGIVSFQPAELLKFSLLIYIAVFLAARMKKGEVNDIEKTVVPLAILLGLSAFFVVVLQKDMGTGLTIIGTVAAMLVVSGISTRILAMGVGVAGVLGLLFILFSPHRIDRVTTFLGGTSVTDASSYHIDMAKLAIGSGGLFGRGLGGGVQAFGYLPEALNDSIFAVLGEIFGFVGLLIILGLFASLLARVLRTSDRVNDPMMKLISAGVFGWLATHVVVNIGAMTGLLPLTGVTLPFLSFGGTSLLFMMLSLGLVYQISRYTSYQTIKGDHDETTRGRRGVGRSRHTSTRRYQRAR